MLETSDEMEERGTCIGRSKWWDCWKEVGAECIDMSFDVFLVDGPEELREIDSGSEEE